MKTFSYIIIILFILFSISACQKDIDTEKPSIDSQYTDAFPLNCDTLYFGEAFEFKTHLSDNEALGSYSVAIHNNFDQHSHSTEVSNCNFDPIKEAINPLVFIEDFDIPSGQ